MDQDCRSPGKHPRNRGGHKNASTDSSTLHRWFAGRGISNVGIRTGAGLLVLDVDPRNGGDASLSELEDQFGRLETYRVETGSGGLHLYFRVEDRFRCMTNWRPGIDIKCDGGYVVAPPSEHLNGGRYRVIEHLPVAAAPEWLVADLTTGPRGPGTEGPSTAQRQSLTAPGQEPDERAHWTRGVVAAIPNEDKYDDRAAWVGMAHAIKASCGPGAESEAFEIFAEFSDRWSGASDYDETERVWDTLPDSAGTGGYPALLSRAREHGYVIPENHPHHAVNEFEAEPLPRELLAELARNAVLSHLEKPWAWARLIELVDKAKKLLAQVELSERSVMEQACIAKIANVVRSHVAARAIWDVRSARAEPGLDSFDGRPVIRASDPTDRKQLVPHLVEGIVPGGIVGELIADYSTGKTWLLLDLSLCVAFGRPFQGATTRSGPVLFLAYEGQAMIWRRVAAWLVAHGFLPDGFTLEELKDVIEDRFVLAHLPPRFDHAAIQDVLRNSIERYGAVLTVIDTRGKSLGADQLEDSADAANHVQVMLGAIATELGCTIISSHHTPLGDKRRGRGSSAWTQGADISWIIEGRAVDFAAGKPVSLTVHKSRDDKWHPPLRFRLREVTMSVDGDAVSGAVVEPVSDARSALEPTGEVFLVVSTNPGASLKAVRDATTGGSTKIDRAIADLIELGAVEDRGTRWKRAYHVVPGWRLAEGAVRHSSDDFPEALAPGGALGTDQS